MGRRSLILILGVLLIAVAVMAQRGRFRFDDEEDNPAPMPADAADKTEYAFARLRYPSGGWGRGAWAIDYPKADRQFVQGVRRLTRLNTKSVEVVVDLESDEIYNWPWIYAVEVGHWELNETRAKKLRNYLDRGGFLMVDDFHGPYEWGAFVDSIQRVYPDRPIVEIENSDAIFHLVYDLEEKLQVPGIHIHLSGRTSEKGGVDPHWRAIYDEQGRIKVAICFNMDNGDAWEWADSPQYPEKYASQAYRIGINYILYAMTH